MAGERLKSVRPVGDYVDHRNGEPCVRTRNTSTTVAITAPHAAVTDDGTAAAAAAVAVSAVATDVAVAVAAATTNYYLCCYCYC